MNFFADTSTVVSTGYQPADILSNSDPKTLPELILRSRDVYGLSDALNYKEGEGWIPISSGQLILRAERIALGLTALGLQKGDRAAILAANCPDWTITDAGCQFAGIVDVPIYTTLAVDAVCYILTDAETRVIFLSDEAAYRRILPAIDKCSFIEKIVLFTPAQTGDVRVMSLAALEDLGADLADQNPMAAEQIRWAVEPDDIATLIYTSGTTGEPKGVILTHANLISNVLGASEKYAFSGQDISLSVLPLSHVFERTGMYVYLMYGMKVFYAESIEKVPDNLREVRPTIFIGVPRIFEKVFAKARQKAASAGRVNEMIFDWAIDVAREYAACIEKKEAISMSLTAKHRIADPIIYAKFREFFGGNLRFCITGGAALSDDIYLIFTGAGISIMQGYGLTETSPVISSNNPSACRLGTVGMPIRDTHVRIASDGEIEVRGPGVMRGYYNKPEETHAAFTDDGWFRTGDIGEIDDDGYLRITDRKKELFKTSGGKYIAPSPIERMIAASRFISQVVLVGNERKFPAALIVPNFEAIDSYIKLKELEIATAEEIISDPRIIDLFMRQIDSLTKRLSKYEKVKRIALLDRELTVEGGELTPTLKVKRRVVDEKYKEIIDKIYGDAEKSTPAR